MRPSPLPSHVQTRVNERDGRLSALGFASYREYLQSDCWRSTKARYRRSSLAQDCICGEVDIHLHHLTYENIGQEALSDLLPLCRDCHAMVHDLERKGRIGLDLSGFALDEDRATAGREYIKDWVDQLRRSRAEALREEQALVTGLPFPLRVLRAVETAKAKRRDVSRQLWMLKSGAMKRANPHKLTHRLRVIEEIAYGWDGWADELDPPALRDAA